MFIYHLIAVTPMIHHKQKCNVYTVIASYLNLAIDIQHQIMFLY